MNYDFQKITECAIKRCQGKYFSEDGSSRNCFYQMYPFTTENISGYINHFDLKDKSLLTVGSSCDQVINAALMNCKDITLLDINIYTKFYYYLKLAALIELNRELFLKFLRFRDYPKVFKDNNECFDINIYNRIKSTLRLLDYETYLFWDELFNTFEPLEIRKNLFSYDEDRTNEIVKTNLYLKNDILYDEAKKKVKKIKPTFINKNLFEVQLSRKFDNIWLSNVASYLTFEEIKIMTGIFYELLNDNGKLLMAYLYETTRDTKYQDSWCKIYDINTFFEIYKDKNIFMETFLGVKGMKFEDKEIKDSVLILKK